MASCTKGDADDWPVIGADELAVRLHRAQGWRQPAADRDRAGVRGVGAREDRPGRCLQARNHGGTAPKDPLRQDSPRHDEEDRRRRGLDHAGHHRRSRDSR
jgi:hypothetical protein